MNFINFDYKKHLALSSVGAQYKFCHKIQVYNAIGHKTTGEYVINPGLSG